MIGELLELAAAGGVGALTATLAGLRRRRRRPGREPEAICPCDHAFGEHGEHGCQHVDVERLLVVDQSTYTLNAYGESMLQKADQSWEVVRTPCACRRYMGPIPVEVYMPAPRPLPEGSQ